MHNWWNYIRKLKCIFVTREFKYSWNSQVYWALLIGLTVEYVSKSKAALPSDHQILNYIVKLVDTVVDQGTLHCITLRFDSHSSHSWSMAGTGNGEKSLRGSGLTVPQNCIIIAIIIISLFCINNITYNCALLFAWIIQGIAFEDYHWNDSQIRQGKGRQCWCRW